MSTTDETLLNAALRVIETDPHLWSKRPCQSCLAVSAIAKKAFGCIKKAQQAATTDAVLGEKK